MAVKFRIKCPTCGEIQNIAGETQCCKCHASVTPNLPAMIRLYRMGSPLGIANGFGIYIDGEPFGYIANKESLRIMLPYGRHTLHLTCGLARKCNDVTFDFTPQTPVLCVKGHMKMGVFLNSMVLEISDPATMPEE